MDSPATLAVVVAFFLALLGAGVSIAYVVGRKGGIASIAPHDDRKLPERYVRELEELLKLGGQANLDSEALTAVLANQKPAVASPVIRIEANRSFIFQNIDHISGREFSGCSANRGVTG